MQRRLAAGGLLLAAIPPACAAVVFAPILRNFFFLDDFLNLQSIVNDPLPRYLFEPWGGHLLVVRNLLFLLFYRLFGTHVAWWFGAILLTHLLNVVLVFAVMAQLGSPRLACFVATLWGIAPIHEGTLGWYSTYGEVVAATLLLAPLLGVVRRWRRGVDPTVWDVARWSLLLLAGANAFGVGVGTALTFPLVLALLFPGERARRARAVAFVLPATVLVEYWSLHALYGAVYGGNPGNINFVMSRFADWRSTLGMFLHLIPIGVTALVAGLADGLRSYPDSVGYTLGATFVAVVVAAVGVAPPRERRLLLALMLIACSAYAIVAAGRGSLFALNPAIRAYGALAAHYHYLATIPLAMVLALALGRLTAGLGPPDGARTATLVGWLGLAGVLFVRGSWHVDAHDQTRQTTGEFLGTIEEALRHTPPGRPVVLANRPFPPAVLRNRFAGLASLYTIWFPPRLDERMRFVEADTAVRAQGAPGSRLAKVLVPPDAAAGAPAGLP